MIDSGVGYSRTTSSDGATRITIGGNAIEVAEGGAVDAEQLDQSLRDAGYPLAADLDQIDWVTLYFWMLVFTVAATALYGPMAAALVEMFPTRIRYTAMSLPYHTGTGWVGGFLPVTAFAIVAMTGDIYAGLWYPIFFVGLSVVCALLFWKDHTGKPLH